MATIIQISNADKSMRLFNKAIKVSGLEEKLSGPGPFTILAPVNLAFESMTPLSLEQLMAPSNKAKLVDFLSGYIIKGKSMLSDFRNEQKLTTLEGKMITASVKNGEVHLNGAKILSKDRQGSNGVIHSLASTYTNP
jgi:uncharacterized surface protein with fasciclin (FAS1) repeats